jgi:hypothetical protein
VAAPGPSAKSWPGCPPFNQVCSESHALARAADARASHASWTTSASSSRVSSPVVKKGDARSWTSACLSASDGTRNTITSLSLSPVSGSVASGRGLRKKTNDFWPTLVDGIGAAAVAKGDEGHPGGQLGDVLGPCPPAPIRHPQSVALPTARGL